MIKNLRHLREEKGISQKQLADVVCVSQQSINKYENHSIEPDINTLIGLADFFDTSVDYLIGHTDIRRKAEPTKPFELNMDESGLINEYRALSQKQRALVRLLTASYSE